MNKTKKPDGGSAFPPNAGWIADDPKGRGMSLRDWFAGQVLGGPLATEAWPLTIGEGAKMLGVDVQDYRAERDYPKIIVAYAYAVADAMLAEREKES